ncbi:gametocyte-specific factor 1 isoform X2 [Genypterus blacodes]
MANTIRFGFSAALGNIATGTSERALEADDFDVRAHNNDPDKLIRCPFDKSHQIRVSRFPYHLVKCSKNHPELARELQTCPYNARHLVPRNELAHHSETCEDRVFVNQAATESESQWKWQAPVGPWRNLGETMTEDWEEEADEHATPFVWGTHPQVKLGPTNNLGPSVRAPDTLPWAKP